VPVVEHENEQTDNEKWRVRERDKNEYIRISNAK
jgi:hypothetical protein